MVEKSQLSLNHRTCVRQIQGNESGRIEILGRSFVNVSTSNLALSDVDLRRASRPQLIDYHQHCVEVTNEWIRRAVIDRNRIDILATEVLGYEVMPFHLRMMQYQFLHPDNLQLAFRGAGKSTTCTVTKAIHLLLKNPNLRILIASKSLQNAEAFLKSIKKQFESNERLAEIFGPYYDSRKTKKWDNKEIEVLPRNSKEKEASITCVGVEGTIVSKHYDVIIADDLIDEENSRTKHMRDKTKQWYYQTLDPTLDPPDPDVPHRGEFHRLGTRYHYSDLYGHLIENELKNHHHIIKALNEKGQSPWPEKRPPEWFAKKKRKSGLIIFNAQYQCDTEAMKGEIFQYDDCQRIDSAEYPAISGLRVFMGVDLAISENESADKFAIAVIGATKDRTAYYTLDYYEGQLRFSQQTKMILRFYRRWDPIVAVIESNQYQLGQIHTLQDTYPGIRVRPKNTDKDKVTRAMKLEPLFEQGRMFFKKNEHDLLVEQLVLFPNYEYKDLFDAFDLAVTGSRMKRRSSRTSEPGVI